MCVLLISCSNDINKEEANKPSMFGNIISSFTDILPSISRLNLTPAEYTSWVKEQKGFTYNEVENEQYSVRLIFHPAQLEAYNAAVANDENPKKTLSKYLEIQKQYYYCTAECVVKYESASAPIKKSDLLALLKNQLTVVENNKDTLHTIITEAFPSYVMNQPNKLLILIPNMGSLSSYKINIQGTPFQLQDCTLNLSSDKIQSFPFIKL